MSLLSIPIGNPFPAPNTSRSSSPPVLTRPRPTCQLSLEQQKQNRVATATLHLCQFWTSNQGARGLIVDVSCFRVCSSFSSPHHPHSASPKSIVPRSSAACQTRQFVRAFAAFVQVVGRATVSFEFRGCCVLRSASDCCVAAAGSSPARHL